MCGEYTEISNCVENNCSNVKENTADLYLVYC